MSKTAPPLPAEKPPVVAGPPALAILYMFASILLSLGIFFLAMISGPRIDEVFGGRQAEFILIWVLPLALAARFLGFTLGKVTFSLDTPVFIAAIFHMEPLPVAWAILVTMLIHAFWRLLRRLGPYAKPESAYLRVLRVLFAPLITASLGLLFCFLVGELWSDPAHPTHGFVELGLRVVGVAVLFLLLQYTLVLVRYWLEGHGARHLFVDVAVPGFLTELGMLPLTLLFVWSLDSADPVPFFVMGGTAVVLAEVFRRFVRARGRALATIEELERLVGISQKVFAVLDFGQVKRALVEAIREEVPEVRRALAGSWDSESQDEVRCVVCALGADGVLDEDLTDSALQSGLEERARSDRPSRFLVASPEGTWVAMIVPFVLNGVPEGFIGVDLGVDASGGSRGLYQHRVGERSREVLRHLAGTAGNALHNARLYQLATIDGLTGLYVRRFFMRRYREEVARCRRGGGSIAVLMIDVDDFKQINDRFGHPGGDEVLRGVAEILRDAMRLPDLPCRLGGDEFVVLLPDTTLAQATITAQRLSKLVLDRVYHFPEGETSVTISIGVSGWDSVLEGELDDLVAQADSALYESKASEGKGRVVVYTATPSESTS